MMLKQSFILFLLSINNLQFSHAEIPKFNTAHVIEIVAEIKRYCPPEDCLYIGVGRSPSVFTTALRLQEGVEVIDLPLSNFRYVAKSQYEVPRQIFMLSPDKRNILFAHFDNYLPPKIKHRKILLIDFSLTGASIASSREFLEIYLQNKTGDAARPEIASFIMTSNIDQLDKIHAQLTYRKIKHFEILSLSDDYPQLEKILRSSNFDNYSRETSFKINNFQSSENYLSNWIKDANLKNNHELQSKLVNDIIADSELKRNFPISCASYY